MWCLYLYFLYFFNWFIIVLNFLMYFWVLRCVCRKEDKNELKRKFYVRLRFPIEEGSFDDESQLKMELYWSNDLLKDYCLMSFLVGLRVWIQKGNCKGLLEHIKIPLGSSSGIILLLCFSFCFQLWLCLANFLLVKRLLETLDTITILL